MPTDPKVKITKRTVEYYPCSPRPEVESAEEFVQWMLDRKITSFMECRSLLLKVVEARDAAIEARVRAEESAKWEAECSALASNQCHAGYGDEYGNHRCRKVDAARAKARRAVEAALDKCDDCVLSEEHIEAIMAEHFDAESDPG